MKSKIEIKKIFFKKLQNKTLSRLINNRNNISPLNINKSFNYSQNQNKNQFQIINNKIKTSNSKCYLKPRPIYIISNIYKNNNKGINLYKPKSKIKKNIKEKKPIKIKSYEIDYNNSDGNITFTKINTERNKHSYDIPKYSNENIKEYNKVRTISDEYKFFNNNLNLRKFFNYKYEQIKQNYKLDKLYVNDNIKKRNNLNTDNNNNNKTCDEIFLTRNLDENKVKIIKKINNFNNKKRIQNYNYLCLEKNDKRNGIKTRSSKSTDIVKLCKILKTLDNNKGTIIKEENDKGGIINLRKDSLDKQKRKNIYIINNDKIIVIQRWWKEILYKKYLKNYIINIQKIYRGFKYRKDFLEYLTKLEEYNKPNILSKIILIQKYWKKYLTCLRQNSISFSFTNNDDCSNINLINNNCILSLGNSYNKNNDIYSKQIPYKNIIHSSFITKKYYTKVNHTIKLIILIQEYFRKIMLKKHKNLRMSNRNHTNAIYYRKNLSFINKSKSRNKKNSLKISIKKEKKYNQSFKYNSKSLIIISPKREFTEFNYNTPNKDKIKKKNFLDDSSYSSISNNINVKELYSYSNSNALSEKSKNIYYINKIKKDNNLLNKIIVLQKKIKNYILKNKYILKKKINNICYISKKLKLTNTKLNNKIILTQKIIRDYIINKKDINYKINLKKTNSDNKCNNLTNDTSKGKNNNENNNNINNKNNKNNNNNNNNISEFDIKDNHNNTVDIIIGSNINSNINSNCKDKNENSFIYNNVTTFSFDFKIHDNDNSIPIMENSNSKNSIKLNISNNDNDNDNDINDNNENIVDDYNISNINNNITNFLSFSSKNMLLSNDRYDYCSKLKSLFVTSITNKLSKFLILILNRLHLFDFIKTLSQKVNKSANQYIFQILLNIYKNQKEYINNNYDLFFFTTLKRHIIYNSNNKENEIKNLLKENIPKCFDNNNYANKNNIKSMKIPYINKINQNNLINTQLFLKNDNNLINYIFNFFVNEKGTCVLSKEILRKRLIKYKLKNRNIFTITKYMDEVYNSIINNELCNICFCIDNDIYNNKKCICLCHKQNFNKTINNYKKMKIKQIVLSKFNLLNNSANSNKIKDISNDKDEDIYNELFRETDEEINDENFNINNMNKTMVSYYKNNSFLDEKNHNLSDLLPCNCNNTLNRSSYKFIDYLNEKCKNNCQLTETIPRSTKEILDSDRNKSKI